MKKTILAVFAHPDDESFGPGGTLALLAQNHDVISVYATYGEACELSHGYTSDTIINKRIKELRDASAILGIKDIHYLKFPDNSLSNATVPLIVKELQNIVKRVKPHSLITFEPRGFSGHLDHIAVTSAVSSLFKQSESIDSINYYGMTHDQRICIEDYFVYCPQGYDDHLLNSAVDISSVWQKKLNAIQAHVSQQKDIDFWMPMLSSCLRNEYFISEYRGKYHPFTEFLPIEYIIKATSTRKAW